MSFSFVPMDEPSAREVVAWSYSAPYDVYNLGSGDVEAAVRVLIDPQYSYYAITSQDGDLVAFCCLGVDARVPGGDYAAPALDIGLGVRPDLTGQGRGITFVNAVLEFAHSKFGSSAFRVTIAGFNVRAQRVWQKAGFCLAQRFERRPDGAPFLVLVREAE